MTLCIAWLENNSIFAISDSRISGGDQLDSFAKIESFADAQIFIAWEGYTGYSLPLLKDLQRMLESPIAFAKSFQQHETQSILEKIIQRLNFTWKQIKKIEPSDNPSFLIGLFDHFENVPKLFLVTIEVNSVPVWVYSEVKANKIELSHLSAIGSGAASFRKFLGNNTHKKSQVLQSFCRVLEDEAIHCTGGVPHIVKLDRRGIEQIGVVQNEKKFFQSVVEDSENPFSPRLKFVDFEELKVGTLEC